MKQTEKQHSNLLTLIYNLINIDLQTKERLEYKDIRSYIDKALSLTHIDCDEEDIAKLTYHIEYTYRITHTEGQCIFSDYEDRTNWYSNDSIKNPYFWSRYRQYLINNTSIDINSINLLDEVTLPNIMNCLGNPNDVFEGNRLRRGLIIGDVESGKTYQYRLLQMDYDGTLSCHNNNIITVSHVAAQNQEIVLEQNAPNPFNDVTYINFFMPRNENVTLEVVDVFGKVVRTILSDETVNAGDASYAWNGRDNLGNKVTTGSYMIRLTVGDNILTKKMSLIRSN